MHGQQIIKTLKLDVDTHSICTVCFVELLENPSFVYQRIKTVGTA